MSPLHYIPVRPRVKDCMRYADDDVSVS